MPRCRIPCACHAKPTSEPSKVVRHWGAFNMLTWKCASRHNGAHFLNISTSKRVPRLMCFVHFDLEMCFAPQRRAIFHLIWPDVSTPAALVSLLFNPPEPQITVDRDFPTSSCTWIFSLLTLSLLWSSLFLSSLLWLFPPLLFHLSILSEVWRLNFLRSVRFKRKINWKYINWFQLKPFLILRFKGASLESKVMVI